MTREETVTRVFNAIIDELDDRGCFNGIDRDVLEDDLKPALRGNIAEVLDMVPFERIGP